MDSLSRFGIGGNPFVEDRYNDGFTDVSLDPKVPKVANEIFQQNGERGIQEQEDERCCCLFSLLPSALFHCFTSLFADSVAGGGRR